MIGQPWGETRQLSQQSGWASVMANAVVAAGIAGYADIHEFLRTISEPRRFQLKQLTGLITNRRTDDWVTLL
jgi:predicted amidohydrolase